MSVSRGRGAPVLPGAGLRRLACLGLACAACTDANLYGANADPNLADKISLRGEICTDDPSAVDFPVKVLFVVDGSAELVAADPGATRATAIQALIERYSGPNHRYGIVQFGTQAHSPTGGFATDTTMVQAGIDLIRVGSTDARRSYLDALRYATTAVQDDLLSSWPGVRSRTRYVIVFVAYGGPRPPLAEAWCPAHGLDPASGECAEELAATFCPDDAPAPADCEALLYPRMVRELRQYALDAGAQSLVFHAISLRADDDRGVGLLSQMATAGHGTFEEQAPGTINLLGLDVSAAESLFTRRELVVVNANGRMSPMGVVADSDGDGLSDEEEALLGLSPVDRDTDGDGIEDGIEHLLDAPGLSFDPLAPSAPAECSLLEDPENDMDLDGLSDCEEAVLRTDPSLVDSDKDGLPDGVEVRRGGNPLVDDALADGDVDGIANGEEIKAGLDVTSNDAENELEFAYRYRFFEEGERSQLEATPTEPMPGVRIDSVSGTISGVALLRYLPGPPQTLAFGDDPAQPPGPAQEVGAGGEYVLLSSSGRELHVYVEPTVMPFEARDERLLLRTTDRYCFSFDVRNVTLVETAETSDRPGRGWNTLWIYLAEQPASSPEGYSVFRAATVPVRFLEPDYKFPDRSYIELGSADFMLLAGGM